MKRPILNQKERELIRYFNYDCLEWDWFKWKKAERDFYDSLELRWIDKILIIITRAIKKFK